MLEEDVLVDDVEDAVEEDDDEVVVELPSAPCGPASVVDVDEDCSVPGDGWVPGDVGAVDEDDVVPLPSGTSCESVLEAGPSSPKDVRSVTESAADPSPAAHPASKAVKQTMAHMRPCTIPGGLGDT